eukprot:scaffold33564_cov69-Phaeocystis_antarctica.AAC.5
MVVEPQPAGQSAKTTTNQGEYECKILGLVEDQYSLLDRSEHRCRPALANHLEQLLDQVKLAELDSEKEGGQLHDCPAIRNLYQLRSHRERTLHTSLRIVAFCSGVSKALASSPPSEVSSCCALSISPRLAAASNGCS